MHPLRADPRAAALDTTPVFAYQSAWKSRRNCTMPIGKDVRLAEGVKIFQPDLVNLYG